MTNLESLRSLQKRIREATGADRELDLQICTAFDQSMAWSGDTVGLGSPRYTLDPDGLGACVALMREVLPGALWSVWDMEEGAGCRLLCPGKGGGYHDGAQISTDPHDWAPPTVCLAFLDAIVSAKIAEMETKQLEQASSDHKAVKQEATTL